MLSQQITFTLRPMGDKAFLVRLLNDLTSPDLRSSAEKVQSDQKYTFLLAARYLSQYLDFVADKPEIFSKAELVAGYDSVLVAFDPQVALDPSVLIWLEGQVSNFVNMYNQDPLSVTSYASNAPRHHHIPVVYGGEYGLDLENVAQLNGITPSEVITLHSSQTYEVYFAGFAPGFAYLGPLPPGLDAPRLQRPRARVKAGTVALAAGLTAIYPHTSPGGWQLIGYTSTQIFLPAQEPPVLFLPGDKVSFYPATIQ